QSLSERRLPIPSVRWRTGDVQLEVTAFAPGEGPNAPVCVRYRLSNLSEQPRSLRFDLAARPLQVNPPSQFLNTSGGAGTIRSIERDATGAWIVNGATRVLVAPAADGFGATSLAGGEIVERLRSGAAPESARAEDAAGRASGVLRWNLTLAPRARSEIDVTA